MKFLLGFAAALALGAVALLLVTRGGYNVAASQADSPLVASLLHTAMRNSVRRRAASITEPTGLGERPLQEGFVHFDAMCIECHGAPGIEPGETGQGLQPAPPSLKNAAQRWQAREIFWILKHGVRMTGMPAFGTTHSDEQLWDLVAVVQRLSTLDAAAYQTVARPRSSHHDSLDAPEAQPAAHQHHSKETSTQQH